MKKTGLNGYVYDFKVDYDAIANDDILNYIQIFLHSQSFVEALFITV